MFSWERKLQTIDILATLGLFVIGGFAGKLIMNYYSDTWLGFNGPAIGVVAIGELVWSQIRKSVKKKLEEKE